MSDNFRILGVGGAGVNIVRSLGYENTVFIDSYHFNSLERIAEYLGNSTKEKDVVIVTSPAGQFSSSVLKTVCGVLNSMNVNISLIAVMPFHSESPERKRRGELVLKELKGDVESTEVVENENFASAMQEYPWTHVMSHINEHIRGLVNGIVSRVQDTSTLGQREMTAYQKSVTLGANAGMSPN